MEEHFLMMRVVEHWKRLPGEAVELHPALGLHREGPGIQHPSARQGHVWVCAEALTENQPLW